MARLEAANKTLAERRGEGSAEVASLQQRLSVVTPRLSAAEARLQEGAVREARLTQVSLNLPPFY